MQTGRRDRACATGADTGARHQAVGRLHGKDTAEGARPNDRPVGLTAERDRNHLRRDGGGRSRRRTAGRALGVVRIAGLAGTEIGELGRYRLADDDCARRSQPGDDGRILTRPATGQGRRAAFRRTVGRVDDVLNSDRNAVQRTDRPSALAPFVALARLRQCVLRVEMGKGLHFRLNCRDPVKAGARISSDDIVPRAISAAALVADSAVRLSSDNSAGSALVAVEIVRKPERHAWP